MPEINLIPHTDQELLEIAQTKNVEKKHLPYFINKYHSYFKDVVSDYNEYPEEELEGDGIKDRALYITIEYMPIFVSELEKGHSDTWADLFADSVLVEDKHVAFRNAYETIKKDAHQKANAELAIHCKAVGGDAFYQKQLIYLMENAEWYNDPNESAAIYSEAYKQQIALGKSEVFAHEYADLMSMQQYSEIGCYSQAQAYDDALKQGKSKEYANLYAEKFSEYVANNFNYMSELEGDEDFEFGHDQIIGYMKGWEYAKANELKNSDQFISIYENLYINTLYADSGWVEANDNVDAQILAQALEKFNKVNNRLSVPKP